MPIHTISSVVAIKKWLTIAAATTATTYGYNEMSCLGLHARPIPCKKGAITASGEIFDPDKVTAALHMPKHAMWASPFVVRIALADTPQKCVPVRINDRKGARGLDLTPGTLRALGASPSRSWSGRVVMCSGVAFLRYARPLDQARLQ
jgi:hypothetical protein